VLEVVKENPALFSLAKVGEGGMVVAGFVELRYC